MNSEMLQKCRSLYEESNQRFYTDECTSVMVDSEHTKNNKVEKRTFTCNIPGVNTSSKVVMYLNVDENTAENTAVNTACPIGGWCGNPSNNFKITDKSKFDITNPESLKIISQSKMINPDDTEVDLCQTIEQLSK